MPFSFGDFFFLLIIWIFLLIQGDVIEGVGRVLGVSQSIVSDEALCLPAG